MSDGGALGLVLDCRDPTALAPLWADALGYVLVGAVANGGRLSPDPAHP
jgi:hypothetical protein